MEEAVIIKTPTMQGANPSSVVVIFGLWVTGLQAASSPTLGTLLAAGQVVLTARGTGSYQGECIRVRVHNRGNSAVSSSIPVGWVFASNTPDVQDLLVVREERFSLAPGGAVELLCRAYCCEASGSGPEQDEVYKPGFLGSPALQGVAQCIARGTYDDVSAQHAIWVLSDGHDIASLGAMDSSLTDTLRLAVSRFSGQSPPRYTVHFAEEPGRICSGRPERIVRELVLEANTGALVSVVVVDTRGRVLGVLHDRSELSAGRNHLPLQVDVLGWPPGNYAIHAWSTDRAGAHRLPFKL